MQISNKENKKFVNIDELHNYAQNPRLINKKDFERLKKHITIHGQMQPLVVTQEGEVLGGNMRLRAYQEIGIKDIWIEIVSPKDDADKLKISLVLNDRAGYYDDNLIANMMPNYNIEWSDYAIDFEPPESLGDMLKRFGVDPIEDEPPSVDEGEAISKVGEIYYLGNHRLMCGDATKAEDVEKLMDGNKADMVFTDPPYAVNYGADQDILNKKSGNKFRLIARPIVGDNLTAEECSEKIWRPAFKNMYEVAKDDCSFYMTMCQGGDQMMMMMMMMSEHWQIKHELIWVKSSPVFSMGRLDYDYQHEPILFGWKKKHNFYGAGKFVKSIWEIPKPSKSDLHPTMKPIELIVNAIQNSSKQDDIVLDLFGGSGSTLIACEQTNRVCYMMEIDPRYVDVIRKRWAKFVYPDKWGTNWEKLTLNQTGS